MTIGTFIEVLKKFPQDKKIWVVDGDTTDIPVIMEQLVPDYWDDDNGENFHIVSWRHRKDIYNIRRLPQEKLEVDT